MELLKKLKSTAMDKLQEWNEGKQVKVNRVGMFTDLQEQQQFTVVAEIDDKICVGRGININIAVEVCQMDYDSKLYKEREYYSLEANEAFDTFLKLKQQLADFCATKTSDVKCRYEVSETDCYVHFQMEFDETGDNECMLDIELAYNPHSQITKITPVFYPEITLDSLSDYLTEKDYSLIKKILS
jgi:hypothetical protein